MPRYANCKDANQADIIDALRKLGADVIDMSDVAPALGDDLAGFPDLLTIWPDGWAVFVEVKVAGARLNRNESVWWHVHENARKRIARTLEDCEALRREWEGRCEKWGRLWL